MFSSAAGFGAAAGSKVKKKKKREGREGWREEKKGPKRISVFKNALSELLFLQNNWQGWRKLESIQTKEQVWENMCTSLPQMNKRRNIF